MAKYESQNIQKSGFSDLINLINSLSSMGGDNQRESKLGNMYKDFASGAELYDNGELEYEQKRTQNFLAKYRDEMDDVDIERFEALNEKYEHQKVLNRDYDFQMERAYSFNKEMMEAADAYGAADSMIEFEGHLRPLADDYDLDNAQSRAQYDADYDKYEAGLYSKRDEYKRNKAEEMKKLVGSYAQFQDGFRKKHGDRFATEAFKYDSQELANLSNVYMFAVDSLEDDGMFDMEERDAYNLAITSKSALPIRNFIVKDTEMKQGRRQTLVDSMDQYVEAGESYQNSLDKFIEVGRVDENSQDWMQKENTVALKIPTGTKDEYDEVTYGELLDAYKNRNADFNNPILVYQRELQAQQQQIFNQLKIKEESIIKNDGASYLETVISGNDNFNRKLKSSQQQGVSTTGVAAPGRSTAGAPPTPPPPPPPTPYGKISLTQTTKGMTKYTSSAKNYVGQLNQISGQLSEFDEDYTKIKEWEEGESLPLKELREEERLLKESGAGFLDPERKELRKEISKLQQEYSEIFTNPPEMVIQIARKKGDKWLQKIAAAAFHRGMNLREYMRWMEKEQDKLKKEYDSKKDKLNTIVSRGSIK